MAHKISFFVYQLLLYDKKASQAITPKLDPHTISRQFILIINDENAKSSIGLAVIVLFPAGRIGVGVDKDVKSCIIYSMKQFQKKLQISRQMPFRWLLKSQNKKALLKVSGIEKWIYLFFSPLQSGLFF